MKINQSTPRTDAAMTMGVDEFVDFARMLECELIDLRKRIEGLAEKLEGYELCETDWLLDKSVAAEVRALIQ